MVKRIVAVLSFLMLVSTGALYAITLLTQEEALKDVFWSGAEIEKETKELNGATLERIKERLGGSLVYTQEGSESAPVESQTTIDFYFAKRRAGKMGSGGVHYRHDDGGGGREEGAGPELPGNTRPAHCALLIYEPISRQNQQVVANRGQRHHPHQRCDHLFAGGHFYREKGDRYI